MFRGLYTATSGMLANNRKQQILTNNLANANTPGYKQDLSVSRSFPEQLIKVMNVENVQQPKQQEIGSLNTGVYVQEGIPLFLQGGLKETGNYTDVALIDEVLPVNPETQQKGSLLFAVALDNGEIRYTRNGQLHVGTDGLLKTSDGSNVLDSNLQTIPIQSEDFTIEENGQIILNNGTSNQQLWIGYTENPEQFVKEGNSLMRWEGNAAAAPQFVENVALLNNTASFVKQGFIEQSNVDLTQTMTDMISTYRSFESNQKVIQAYDRSMDKSVNEIGRVY